MVVPVSMGRGGPGRWGAVDGHTGCRGRANRVLGESRTSLSHALLVARIQNQFGNTIYSLSVSYIVSNLNGEF